MDASRKLRRMFRAWNCLRSGCLSCLRFLRIQRGNGAELEEKIFHRDKSVRVFTRVFEGPSIRLMQLPRFPLKLFTRTIFFLVFRQPRLDLLPPRFSVSTEKNAFLVCIRYLYADVNLSPPRVSYPAGFVSSSCKKGLLSTKGDGELGLSRSAEKSAFSRSLLRDWPRALRAHDRSVGRVKGTNEFDSFSIFALTHCYGTICIGIHDVNHT